jgi:hypothetical protein
MSQERPQRNASKKVSYYTEKQIKEFVNPPTKRKRADAPPEEKRKKTKTAKGTKIQPKADQMEEEEARVLVEN